MALEDDRLCVRAVSDRAVLEHAGVRAEAHGAALVGDVALFWEEVDDRVRRERVELGRVRVVGPEGLPRELDDHALHAHAEPERGDPLLASEADRLHLALDAAVAEAARHDDSVEADERLDVAIALELLAVDPAKTRRRALGPRGVPDGLDDREVRVRQLDVLADHGDLERDARAPDAVLERTPLGQVRLARLDPELLDDDPAEPRVLEHRRDAVDAPRVGLGDDVVDLHVAEERDLSRSSSESGASARAAVTSGWIPIERRPFQECRARLGL